MINKINKFFEIPFYIKKEKLKRLFWIIKKNYYGNFGKNSILEKPLIIYNKDKIFIGDNVTIRPNLRIEPITKWIDKTYNPSIHIGNNTNIEQNCHITCANNVVIGRDVTILGYTCITDINHQYENIDEGILKQPLLVKETFIGDGSFIGMGSRIMAGVKIGKHCIIGANAVVNKNIPDYCIAVGVPARIIKRYNFDTKKWEKVIE